MALGLPEAALKAYQDGFAIGDRLAKADPGNAVWQRDLAQSYQGFATLFAAQGDKRAALSALQKGRAIIVQLGKQSPSDATLPSVLGWFDRKIAKLSQEDAPQPSASPATGWWRKLTSLWR